jgi:hypothetical protein
LLGAHLDVTILLDSNGTGNRRLLDLADQGILDPNRIIRVGSITGAKRTDIEDLFEASEYLSLYNEAFGAEFDPNDLVGNAPILKRIERKVGSAFDHHRPSTQLLRNKGKFFDFLVDGTRDRFEALLAKINATLVRRLRGTEHVLLRWMIGATRATRVSC